MLEQPGFMPSRQSPKPSVWPESVFIVRHGESAGNIARDAAVARRDQVIDLSIRDVDVPLSPLGEQQARALGRWFGGLSDDEKPTVIISSPYLRALNTTHIISDIAQFPYASDATRLIVDERFREKEFGILDRLTRYGIAERYPEQAELRAMLGKFYHRPPGGESWCDVILRLRSAFEMICREFHGERVLIVCHSVVVLCMRYLIEQLTEQEILGIDQATEIANCSVTRFEVDPALGTVGKLTLRAFNFVAPLRDEGTPITSTPDVPAGMK
jgi:probable phosphoglycerate mutase